MSQQEQFTELARKHLRQCLDMLNTTDAVEELRDILEEEIEARIEEIEAEP